MYCRSLVLLVSVTFMYVQSDDIPENGCIQQKTCGACIKYASETCVWCPAVLEKNETIIRCQTEAFSRSESTWCPKDVENPQNKIKPTQEDPISLKTKKKVHLSPQKITIKARPGVPQTFNISYQLGLRYPLDVYFLMDFSDTMIDHMDNLNKQVNNIYLTLKDQSDNVQLGMGSFIDKPGPPIFDNTVHNEAYSFRNHINLTDSLPYFVSKLKNLSLRNGNNDIQESGLEALMQVILCKDYIRFRPEAQRFIVLFTDSSYHIAGEGKIVGAFRPFDMKCHVENNEYSEEKALTLDYPSLGQISQIVKQEGFHVIFAIDNKVKQPYRLLANQIEGAKCTDLRDSRHISKILSQSYRNILRFPSLKIIRAPPFVQIKLDPPCLGSVTNKPECEVKNPNSKKNMSITITLTNCTDSNIPVEIGLVGLSDTLTINVEALCECDCEKNPGIPKSEMCSKSGTYQCGFCKCDENWSGDICDCDTRLRNARDYDRKCFQKDEEIECSGHGRCRCGKCECRQEAHGPFCQFSDRDCSEVCLQHGRCLFGNCICNNGWIGDDCTCTESKLNCMDPYTKKECAGHGDCICGQCKCNKSESNTQYTGKFCDECSTCAERRCEELKSFVECLRNTTQENEHEDCWEPYHQNKDIYHRKKDITVVFVNKTEIAAAKYLTFDWCSIPKTEGTIVYRHKKVFEKLDLIIQKDLDIPPKVDIWTVVYSIIGVILLIGLVILITWRILVDIHDTKEYNKFKEEVEELDFETAEKNPLYKTACTEVTNPAYRRRSVRNN